MHRHAIKREKHIMPTLDDLNSDLNGSTVFSKLDLSNAYHQLEHDDASRQVTTFTTRWYSTLQALVVWSECSYRDIPEILTDIPGVRNLSDDIIVFGKTQAEHNINL